MIQEMSVWSFQSHKKTTLTLSSSDFLVALVGPSDSGKSAFMRACEYGLLFGKPYVRSGDNRVVFDAFMNDIKILPPENREHCRAMQRESGDEGVARGVADYIAGMTDRYAIVEYERIFNPRQLSFVNLIP